MPAGTRLVDVATAAGVSLRTASRVLNGDHRVADDTRDRVSRAIRDLQFEPDVMARSLRAGTDTAIGFAVESIADPFFAEMIDTVEAEMARHGRSVLVASTRHEGTQEHAVVRRMFQRRIAGLLIAPSGVDLSWLAAVPGTVVLVDRAAPSPTAPDPRGPESAGAGNPGLAADLVDIDDHAAAVDAVTHLIEHGHRRIGYLGDTTRITTSAARLRGYCDALRRHGIEIREELIASTAQTSADAAAATATFVDLADRDVAARDDRAGTDPVAVGTGPTAIFSATTRASIGAIPVLHSRRRTDLAFVGLGDFAMADALVPAVTVIDHSGRRVGAAAARRLLARLADPDLAVEHVRLPAPLIARGSGELRP